jgi:hypothetical protein
VRHRASATQHVMSKFKNRKGKSKRWQYRAYAKAKRTFTSCVAKLKNLVKDLHYKTCAYLTEHYDVILLPIFKTKDMARRSSARTHGFNTSILSLNHFKFRPLLQVKCAVKGSRSWCAPRCTPAAPAVAATDCTCASAAATCLSVRSARTALVGTTTPLSISCDMYALDHSKSSSEIRTSFTGLQWASRTQAAMS